MAVSKEKSPALSKEKSAALSKAAASGQPKECGMAATVMGHRPSAGRFEVNRPVLEAAWV